MLLMPADKIWFTSLIDHRRHHFMVSTHQYAVMERHFTLAEQQGEVSKAGSKLNTSGLQCATHYH